MVAPPGSSGVQPGGATCSAKGHASLIRSMHAGGPPHTVLCHLGGGAAASEPAPERAARVARMISRPDSSSGPTRTTVLESPARTTASVRDRAPAGVELREPHPASRWAHAGIVVVLAVG